VFSQIWLNLLTDGGHSFLGTTLQPVKEREGEKGGRRERYREFFFAKKWAHVITLCVKIKKFKENPKSP
jgi:hypothetical protein